MTSGPVLFARYAYPPNALGYCGPDAADELLERASAGSDSPELRRLAQGFEGAWPYLELIAQANGLADPLASEVVEAYWIGNRLLDAVGPGLFRESVEGRFRPRLGVADWAGMDAACGAGSRPHHGFHVFFVYPWVGLLRTGPSDAPLQVLDRCRIRWGQVVELEGSASGGGTALVRSRPLVWDGSALGLGETRIEAVRCPAPLASELPDARASEPAMLRPGDWCSLHWDWVCDRLDERRLSALRRITMGQLALANAPARHVLA